MPDRIYELIARGARYWFLLLMLVIVWRSLRWYLKDKKTYRSYLRRLPDAGNIGRMVILHGSNLKQIGQSYAVPREGTIGSSRMNDIWIRGEGIQKVHLRFYFKDQIGLMIEKANETVQASIDASPLTQQTARMVHESHLCIGEVELQLLLFEGFECSGNEELDVHQSVQDHYEESVSALTYAPERRRRGKSL